MTVRCLAGAFATGHQGLGLRLHWYLLACAIVATGLAAACAETKGIEGMVRVRLTGGLVEGRPLDWNSQQIVLLARDGQLVTFQPSSAQDLQRSSPNFAPYSASEMRARLHAEFGRDFEVTPTQHYLVVHPRGGKDLWARRFEELYRSFYHYFQVRGLKLHDTRFPLVAVVFARREEYQRYSAEHGMRISPNYLGHYSPQTNRVYLFDVDGGGGEWEQNAELIIHEATHQTAYNTGVHSRFAATPRWLGEGLAMMFEARGVWNSSRYRSQSDRLNRGRLDSFRRGLPQRREAWFAELIRSDGAFQGDEGPAYAESWAFSFFLCETRPRLYTKYLERTAARENFADYPAQDRLADFTAIFGDNWKQLDAEFLRFVKTLR